MIRLSLPTTDAEIAKLRVGDQVLLRGTLITGRDAAHHYIIENFIKREPPENERQMYEILRRALAGNVIYHCGPVVAKENGKYKFVAAGPTTSIREEPYEHLVIEKFNVKGVIGKGGMGAKTLAACRKYKAVYFHAIGGAATYIAQSVKEVIDVYKLDLGVPEAMWLIRVEDFPAVVTMDSHGGSLHAEVEARSKQKLEELLATIK
ncbi:MAG: fumarate hydratase C-terminal domain-containing protein [candidate division KSB1 bacterium]|nr:fumarate hydratase C-terminal domain-containing protein [candidate division KSB1 bacterium]MDZ7287755.1 fumarate hydratase C-terminal domain-containing protein [candidate division KSB1 bacterium]MDZ7299905.1 fumarate hydratase C-terminal domain-containing protein [candidate division KSB1 bacterium]MDZ7308365.1 fumarate hydratase C-terminal domain-containing protein [candidate division KSB1 bacterium]MDZ7350904.1 fumarate hydratase C-terminal domain-containing protein [candidate division KSB1